MAAAPPVAAAPTRIPRSVWVLGFVSLFMDISSEMIHSLLPVFMVTSLGASALVVGVVEGLAEATALVVRVFSGTLSDYLGRRKALAVAGYSLGAISKPLFALAATVQWVFFARFVDRIGKGIRGAPRDALIADLTDPAVRGAAYGLRQSLDTIGAFLGPLLAVALMLLFAGDFRSVFWLAVIPGALSVALLVFGVHEAARAHGGAALRPPLRVTIVKTLPREYWWVVAAGAVFTLSRFSEAFLLLRAQQQGLPDTYAPFVLVLMNLVFALSAYPMGRLADRVSPLGLLAAGVAVLVVADLTLALSNTLPVTALGVALWGLHMGMTQGVLAAMIAATSPAEIRGTAFGVFYLASGLSMLCASVLAGWLWERYGAEVTFFSGAAFAVAAFALFSVGRVARGTREA